MKNIRKFFLGPLFIIIIVFIFITANIKDRKFQFIVDENDQSNSVQKTENKFSSIFSSNKKQWKTIAFGTPYLGVNRLWKKIFQRQISNECEEKRCTIQLNIGGKKTADAVVFNGNDLKPNDAIVNQVAKYRRQDQQYVFFSMEAPPILGNERLMYYKNFFNWTMTYRRDSDVIFPYGQVIKRKNTDPAYKPKYLTQEKLEKKKKAMWFVSNCHTQSKREDFVKELRKYITVDIYGNCGNKKCGRDMHIVNSKDVRDDPCVNLMDDYVFYLALENSLCTDYITEKFFRALNLGIIPIAFGPANYTAVSPPNSFIESKDFATVKDLADFMLTVSKDVNLYNTFLKWQEEYYVDVGSPYKPLICDLCKKLHSQKDNSSKQSHADINGWYTNKNVCKDPKDYIH